MSSTKTEKNNCIFDEGKGAPMQALFPILLSAECSHMFSPISVQPVDDRKDCAPAVQPDRQLSPNVVVFLRSEICSKSLDKLLPKDAEVPVLLPFRLVCMRSRHHLLVKDNRVILT